MQKKKQSDVMRYLTGSTSGVIVGVDAGHGPRPRLAGRARASVPYSHALVTLTHAHSELILALCNIFKLVR